MSPYFEYLMSEDAKSIVNVMERQADDAPSKWQLIGHAPFLVALAKHDPFITPSGFPHAPCYSPIAKRPR